MKTCKQIMGVAVALALGTAVFAEDSQLLRAKAELLVDQAKEFYDDSCRKGSELHGPQFRHYFGLMVVSGTNLLARAKSQKSDRRLAQYCELMGKDYEAYTKVAAATEMAAATGGTARHRGKSDARHRAKRMINAEKLGDRELAAAIARWERFVKDIQRDGSGRR